MYSLTSSILLLKFAKITKFSNKNSPIKLLSKKTKTIIKEFLFRGKKIALGLFKINIDLLVLEFGAFLKEDTQAWYWNYMRRQG